MLSEKIKSERSGKITASQAYRLVGARGLGQGGVTYAREIIAEEMGYIQREIKSYYFDWGNYWAPFAIEHYEKHTGLKVDNSGEDEKFIVPDWNTNIGCTPDGLIKKLNSGIEVKCPETGGAHVTFLEVSNGEELKDICSKTTSPTVKHVYWQIQFSLWITGFKFWHFVSFHPEFKDFNLWIVKIDRNEDDIQLINNRVAELLTVKQKILDKIAER